MANLAKNTAERFWHIKHFDIFKNLEQADADALARITTFKSFKTGEQLNTPLVYLLKEGRIRIYQTSPTNHEEPIKEDSGNNTDTQNTILAVLEPGEIFGLEASEDAHLNVTVETLTDVVVGTVTISNFQFFLKRKPHLAMPVQRTLRMQFQRVLNFLIQTLKPAHPLMYLSAQQTSLLQNKPNRLSKKTRNLMSNIAFRHPEARLALLLQKLAAAPTTDGTVWARKLSSKALSRLIGCTEDETETLLTEFKQHNLIKNHFRRIQILDTWRLKKIADARSNIRKYQMKPNPHIPNNLAETEHFTAGTSPNTTTAVQAPL